MESMPEGKDLVKVATSEQAPVVARSLTNTVVYQRVLLGFTAISAIAAVVLGILLIAGTADRLVLADLLWKVLFGTAGFGGIYAALRRADTNDASLALQERQFQQTQAQLFANEDARRHQVASEAFISAVDRLCHESVLARAGAVYSLEAVVRDWPEFHWRMVEILCVFLRSEHLKFPEVQKRINYAAEKGLIAMPFDDVEAATRVLGRRNPGLDEGRLRLVKAQLPATDFQNGKLADADFYHAKLRSAFFRLADLSRVRFNQCDLTGAMLMEADLDGATFDGATLDGADFTGARNLKAAQLATAASAKGVIGAPT